MAAHYVAYVEHVTSRQRKYVKSTDLLEVEDSPRLRCKPFVLDKSKKPLFVKNKEYGKLENDKIVRYYVLLMEETKEKVIAKKEGKRVNAPPARLSLGPSEHPVAEYEMVREQLESQEDKAATSRTSKKKRELEDSNDAYKRFLEKSNKNSHEDSESQKTMDNEFSALEKQDPPKISNSDEEAMVDDNESTVISAQEKQDPPKISNSDEEATVDDNEFTVISAQEKQDPPKNSNSDVSGDSDNPEQQMQDPLALSDECLGCQVKTALLDAKHAQLQTAVSEVEALRLQNSDLQKEIEVIKTEAGSEAAALRMQIDDLRKALQTASTSQSAIAKLNEDLNKLPEKIKNASASVPENCWVSSVPKYPIQLEEGFKDLEVFDTQVYFGNGKIIDRLLLEKCDYPNTLRGRVSAIVKQLYGNETYMYSNSGKRTKDMVGYVPVKQFPKNHFTAIDVVLRHMPWTGLEKERAKLNDGTVKEDVRKFLFDECESYLLQNKPQIFQGIKKARKAERDRKAEEKKKKAEDGKDQGNEELNKSIDESL